MSAPACRCVVYSHNDLLLDVVTVMSVFYTRMREPRLCLTTIVRHPSLSSTLGYISVLKYFDSIVVSVIMLMEPVVGVFIGRWVGVDSLPSARTWIGSAIVTVGSGLVVYSGATKTESIDATQAVRPRATSVDCGKSSATRSTQTTRVEMRHTPIMMRRPSPQKRAA